jgi:hypothetical protein
MLHEWTILRTDIFLKNCRYKDLKGGGEGYEICVRKLLLEYSFDDGGSCFLRNIYTCLKIKRCHTKAESGLDMCVLYSKRIAYDVEP